MRPTDFPVRVLAWYDRHGRRGLPWQKARNPYQIWIAEVMLQQTQVSAVAPYYSKFLSHFPSVAVLAGADLDAVMAQWSGLGYYARARNLHSAAQLIMNKFNGTLPDTMDGWMALPGIGRSSAAAILAQAFGQRHAILDGNVQRVLARCFGVEGWPGKSEVKRRLWSLADSLLPQSRIEAYTQALMDLGATVCTPRAPKCRSCPLVSECAAYGSERVASLPTRRSRRLKQQRILQILLVYNLDGHWLLERRPSTGIWGGLWCPPLAPIHTAGDLELHRRFAIEAKFQHRLPEVKHAFTHFTLQLLPRMLCSSTRGGQQAATLRWFTIEQVDTAGIPAPVRRLFMNLYSQVQGQCQELFTVSS